METCNFTFKNIYHSKINAERLFKYLYSTRICVVKEKTRSTCSIQAGSDLSSKYRTTDIKIGVILVTKYDTEVGPTV